jgi:hypothetical protein
MPDSVGKLGDEGSELPFLDDLEPVTSDLGQSMGLLPCVQKVTAETLQSTPKRHECLAKYTQIKDNFAQCPQSHARPCSRCRFLKSPLYVAICVCPSSR